MANRFASLLTAVGIGLVSASSFIYQVDPGEKALIMNIFSGLQRKVYHQGYHFRVPFV